MSGCATSPAKLEIDRAAAKGAAEAKVQVERQPDECGKEFALLPESQVVGAEARTVIRRYEAMIVGEVNPRIRTCYRFNEKVRKGLSNG